MSKLYVIPTPIGNIKDITIRAIDVLKEVDCIACEDTRRAGILLRNYFIHKPLIAVYQGKEKARSKAVLKKIQAGETVALITDAGTPGIQDPGFYLIRSCLEADIPVESLPGPTAAICALTASGLPTDSFLFDGFLPVKSGPRKRKIQEWQDESRTIIFYESPFKIIRTLKDIQDVLGDVPIVVCRELTKKFEETLRYDVSEMIRHFEKNKPKGEFVIMLSMKGLSLRTSSTDRTAPI